MDLTPLSFLGLGLEESGLNRPGGVCTVFPSNLGYPGSLGRTEKALPAASGGGLCSFHPTAPLVSRARSPTILSHGPTPGRWFLRLCTDLQ